MKRKIIGLVSAAVVAAMALAGCSGKNGGQGAADASQIAEDSQDKVVSGGEAASQGESSTDKVAASAVILKDGTYTVDFDTDSSMFHVSEACDGKGILTVKDGEMNLHVSLTSKNIVNLFPGRAEDAKKDGAEILEPTTDEVTYSDGITEEVYGFDIPVPALEQEFDLALVGTKGTWYDHRVIVSNPEKTE